MQAQAHQQNTERPPVLDHLPPFRPVAIQLMRLVSAEDPPIREVAQLVKTDSAFTAEILRLANSPVLGMPFEVRDMLHAMAVLGTDRLRGLILTLAMKDIIGGAEQDEVLVQSWRHSLASALIAEALAEASWHDKNLAYTTGLLHDIGVLIYLTAYGDDYATMVRSAPDSPTLRRWESENYGMDHGEASRWLFEDWSLPTVFSRVALHGHLMPPGNEPIDDVGIVYIASATADMAGFPVCGEAARWSLPWTLSWFEGAIRKRLATRLEQLPLEIATKINAFDCEFITPTEA